MQKRITAAAIDQHIDRADQFESGELESLKARVQAQQRVLCALLETLDSTALLRIWQSLHGEGETYICGEGYVEYVSGEGDPE